MAFEKKEPTGDEKPKATTSSDAKEAKKAKPKQDRKPRASARKTKPGPGNLEDRLTETVTGIGIGMVTVGNVNDGIILISRGPALCSAWADVAKVNKQVDAVLRKLVEGGVWGGVIISTASVALPMIQNHGIATRAPNPFPLTQNDLDALGDVLPEELQMMVAMRASRQQAPPEPTGTPTGPNGTGTPEGPQATAPPAHNPE